MCISIIWSMECVYIYTYEYIYIYTHVFLHTYNIIYIPTDRKLEYVKNMYPRRRAFRIPPQKNDRNMHIICTGMWNRAVGHKQWENRIKKHPKRHNSFQWYKKIIKLATGQQIWTFRPTLSIPCPAIHKKKYPNGQNLQKVPFGTS